LLRFRFRLRLRFRIFFSLRCFRLIPRLGLKFWLRFTLTLRLRRFGIGLGFDLG
jgi:hypothetical protein